MPKRADEHEKYLIWERRSSALQQHYTDGNGCHEDQYCGQHAEPFFLYGNRCEHGAKNAEICDGDPQHVSSCLWRCPSDD